MEIDFGQGEELAERAGVAHDAEHRPSGAMAAHTATTPRTIVTAEVDFADDALANEIAGIGRDYFADELVAGNAGESVVSAPEFEIGVADASLDQADKGEAIGPIRFRRLPDGGGARFQVNGNHLNTNSIAFALPFRILSKGANPAPARSGPGSCGHSTYPMGYLCGMNTGAA